MKDYQDKVKAIERELARRKRENRIDYYNTGEKVHKKQVAFHKSQMRSRWVFGGNRSGKTECGAVEVAYLARGNHPHKKNEGNTAGWVVSLSQQVQRDVAQGKLLSYIKKEWICDIVMLRGKGDNPSGGVIDYIDIYNASGGVSRIGFKSCDQGREKFQGTSLDYVWFDEEPPQDIYEECRMRVLDRKGVIFGTMTPLKGLSWVYYDIYLNEKCDTSLEVFFMEWRDNPYLDTGEVEAMSAMLSKESLESRRYGRFSSGTGLVYTEFVENTHVIEPFDIPQDWQDMISIDPGLNNPLSCHFYATDYDGNIYVIGEHYEAGRDISHHAEKIRALAKMLDWHMGASGKIEALIDSAASQRTLASSKSVCELFYEHGIAVNPKVNKELFSGISRVKEYFSSSPTIYIFKNCTNLIRELKGYWWGDGDVPKKKDDHSLDELRYYIMTKPKPTERIKLEKSEVQKNKERLIRKLHRRGYK